MSTASAMSGETGMATPPTMAAEGGMGAGASVNASGAQPSTPSMGGPSERQPTFSRTTARRVRSFVAEGRRLSRSDKGAALSKFEEALELAPGHRRVLCEAGFLAHRAGDNPKALRYIEKGLLLYGDPLAVIEDAKRPLAICLYNHALVLEATGATADARQALSVSQSLRPNRVVLRRLRALGGAVVPPGPPPPPPPREPPSPGRLFEVADLDAVKTASVLNVGRPFVADAEADGDPELSRRAEDYARVFDVEVAGSAPGYQFYGVATAGGAGAGIFSLHAVRSVDQGFLLSKVAFAEFPHPHMTPVPAEMDVPLEVTQLGVSRSAGILYLLVETRGETREVVEEFNHDGDWDCASRVEGHWLEQRLVLVRIETGAHKWVVLRNSPETEVTVWCEPPAAQPGLEISDETQALYEARATANAYPRRGFKVSFELGATSLVLGDREGQQRYGSFSVNRIVPYHSLWAELP